MTGAIFHSPLGLIAGNGTFPLEFARNAARRGLEVVAVAHRGETDPAIDRLVKRCTWVRVGELEKIISILSNAGVRQAAFAGGIRRPRLFGGVKLDALALKLIARIGSTRDDTLLRAVAAEVEARGIQVISASALLEESLARPALFGERDLLEHERADALLGWDACLGVGALDIGQTVIVKTGTVVAVEALEGTDQAILRAGKLAGKGCVVVKLAKPQQDLRLDLPTIGTRTIKTLKKAGAAALILQAGKAIVLESDKVAAAAKRAGVVVKIVAEKNKL